MFGRLLSFEPDATGVTVKFEHKEEEFHLLQTALYEYIARWKKSTDHQGQLCRNQKRLIFRHVSKEFITIKTKKLLVRVRDEFQVDFLTPDGRMISEQTARTTKKQEITAQQAELLAKEGHELPKSSQIIHLKLCVCFIQRSISMVLAIRLAFLIKEATLMKCGTATFQIRMQIFPKSL